MKTKVICNDENGSNKGEDKVTEWDKAYLLKYADGKFWREELKDIPEIHADKYQICHDIVATLFYTQLNGDNEAYTSTSGINGHHNMESSGTLIFWRGEPVYVFDDETSHDESNTESFENTIERFKQE